MTKDETKVLKKAVHDLLLMEKDEPKPQRKAQYAYARKKMIELVNELNYHLFIDNYQVTIKKGVQK